MAGSIILFDFCPIFDASFTCKNKLFVVLIVYVIAYRLPYRAVFRRASQAAKVPKDRPRKSRFRRLAEATARSNDSVSIKY